MALGHVISVASDEVNEEMEEQYAVLLKQNKFWKFARHKSPNVSIPRRSCTQDVLRKSVWLKILFSSSIDTCALQHPYF